MVDDLTHYLYSNNMPSKQLFEEVGSAIRLRLLLRASTRGRAGGGGAQYAHKELHRHEQPPRGIPPPSYCDSKVVVGECALPRARRRRPLREPPPLSPPCPRRCRRRRLHRPRPRPHRHHPHPHRHRHRPHPRHRRWSRRRRLRPIHYRCRRPARHRYITLAAAALATAA